ncbi:MAG: hypothetical protein U0869_23925 [Chloroflexota bacterium]
MRRSRMTSIVTGVALVMGSLFAGAVVPAVASAADLCQPGSSSSTGTAPCDLAQPGTYVDVPGALAPLACPAGTYSDAPGAVACTLAPLGAYVSSAGSTTYALCPAGTTTHALGSTQCVPIVTSIDDEIDQACADDHGHDTAFHKQAEGIRNAPNAKARAGKLGAFTDHVNAQRGKALTSVEADLLIQLARQL